MVSLGALWLPILVAAALVWVAGAIVWMVLPHHRNDFRQVPDEEAVRDALSSDALTPGQYTIPHAPDREAYQQPEIQEKFEEGPVAFLTVLPTGTAPMGKQLTLYFVYAVAVSLVAGYVASRTLGPGTAYMEVFQITGTVAWVAYGAAYVQEGVWFGRPWSFVVKNLVDALLYGLLTAGVFGWLWPA
ncbi:MAG: hypothetical protein ACOC9H_02340 [Gemmatimonadota bacterium]